MARTIIIASLLDQMYEPQLIPLRLTPESTLIQIFIANGADVYPALELTGSIILLQKDDVRLIDRAFRYWNRATDLRETKELMIR